MDFFPVLSTGAVTQFPSSRVVEHKTVVLSYCDGSEQRFRALRRPVRKWIIRLTKVSESELYQLEEFFNSQQGRAGIFSFTDPWTGVVHPRCSMDLDEFSVTVFGNNTGATTLTVREIEDE